MSTAAEVASTSKEPAKSSDNKNDVPSSPFEEGNVTRASVEDVVGREENRTSAGTPETPPRVEVKQDTIVQRIKSWSPVLVLENSGSVARDHLASERTWLAYIRTSLAISSSGVALVQLFTIAANRSASDPTSGEGGGFTATIQRFARPLGAATVLIGLGVCLLGLYRYFIIQSSLTQGKFPTARLEVHTVSLLLGALTGVVFGVLVSFPR